MGVIGLNLGEMGEIGGELEKIGVNWRKLA